MMSFSGLMQHRFLFASLLLVPLVVLGIASIPATADRNQVQICHYQKGRNAWRLITVSARSAERHFERHDDAIPGGVTAVKGLTLNASCEEKLPDCDDCLEANGEQGCDQEQCEDLVCTADPFCCQVVWDMTCADAAVETCLGNVCSM